MSFAVGDVGPIFLLVLLYKFVTKILTARLAKAIGKLISFDQSNFIRGKHLFDGVVALNEVINLAKVFKKDCFIFKLDYEKTYYSIN